MAKKTSRRRGQGPPRRKKSKGITLTTDEKLQLLQVPNLDEGLKRKILNS